MFTLGSTENRHTVYKIQKTQNWVEKIFVQFPESEIYDGSVGAGQDHLHWGKPATEGWSL